jgi:hypothetical protein
MSVLLRDIHRITLGFDIHRPAARVSWGTAAAAGAGRRANPPSSLAVTNHGCKAFAAAWTRMRPE